MLFDQKATSPENTLNLNKESGMGPIFGWGGGGDFWKYTQDQSHGPDLTQICAFKEYLKQNAYMLCMLYFTYNIPMMNIYCWKCT